MPPQATGGIQKHDFASATTAYKRQATAVERFFTRSPFSVVTMVAQIEGEVTEAALTDVVEKIRQRHANLRVLLEDDDRRNPWSTTEAAAAKAWGGGCTTDGW